MFSEMMCRRFWQQEVKEAPLRAERRKPGRARSCRGRLQGPRAAGRGRTGGARGQQQRPDRLSLRPVNVKGNRARGMRAPKNTNQFLMHEKYQMLHMRSDSVGSDSGCSSDSDAELTDMDSYLGVLENARGALLDSPNPHGSASAPGPFLVLQEGLVLQEDSMQYFPSEDDLLQSQNFMQKDFVEFCDVLTP
ncbi:coiled-coil domain-containing glutamate-rich protein 1 [Stegastes partitus]|uniref:Coiled-coil domain-containing glutamate-rich protein 1 n=1 Tax=Stegastes partitus TaxID=144197 RepID=A0A9Y4NHD3_9TELE|nr:PREDICTED: coiled-coil domain-containing glutamate-rich protein 1-like [Stegastes partitus]